MSSLYRFGFEFGQVPSGVVINSGNYYWDGRLGNCSLYGNWPNVTCQLASTTSIRGSLYAQTFNHDLNSINHAPNQSIVEFGNVKLQSNGSGAFAINVGGSDVSTVSSVDMYRGEWIPIKFQIDLGSPSNIQFGVKGQNISSTSATSLSSETSITIGGLNGTGCLDDIAINSSSGPLDTSIPNNVACIPAYYTGNTTPGWMPRGALEGYIISLSNIISGNTYGSDVVYSPFNNKLYITGPLNGNPKLFNAGNSQIEQWLDSNNNKVLLNRVAYCPSRNSIFYSTGLISTNTSLTGYLYEHNLNDGSNNFISSFLFNNSNNDSRYPKPAFYHAKTNRIYFNGVGSDGSKIFYINCTGLTTGSISLANNTDNTAGHAFFFDSFSDNIFYYSLQGSINTISYLNLINQTNGSALFNDGAASSAIWIATDLNSGIITSVKTSDQFTLFNLTNFSELQTGRYNIFNNGPLSYSKVSKNFIAGDNLSIFDINNTGGFINLGIDNTYISTFRNGRGCRSYCGYNDCSYFIDNSLNLYSVSHAQRKYRNLNAGNYVSIQFDDSSSLRSYISGNTENYYTLIFTGTSYEGTNLFYKIRTLGVTGQKIAIGINEGGANISLSELVPPRTYISSSVSSFYAQNGDKLTVNSGNLIRGYIENKG